MEAEHRDLKAVVDTKSDRKEVIFRHEADTLITKVLAVGETVILPTLPLHAC